VLATVVAVGVAVGRSQSDPRPSLAQALRALPDDTQTANFTDWDEVRRLLGMAQVSSASPPDQREALLAEAYASDLSSVSALAGSVDVMAEHYGWSVLDVEWEAFGQSRAGAVSVVSLGPGVDPAAVTAGLGRLGYEPPESDASTGGIWHGGGDLVARLGPQLSPALAEVAVLADRRLVVASDAAAYASRTVETITTGDDSLGDAPDAAATALPLYGSAVAVVHQLPRACRITSFATADLADRADAVQRAEAAGGLLPQRALGFGVAQNDRMVLRTVLRFASSAEAVSQTEVRQRLTTGEATGQGGTYDERFRLVRADVQGSNLVLEMEPVTEPMSLLSDLTSGPLLFTWCGPHEQEQA